MQILRHFEYAGHHVTLVREDGQRTAPSGRADECDQFWFASVTGSDTIYHLPPWECWDEREALQLVQRWIDGGMTPDHAT